MAQCKATTGSGTQCVSEAVAPSRSLCGRHQTVLASGKPVVNFESGRKFPAPAAPVAKAKAKTASKATAKAAPKAAARSARATASKPAPRRAAVATASRASTRAAAPVVEEAEEDTLGPGEHPLGCRGPKCNLMTLPGTNYCMKHQSLA